MHLELQDLGNAASVGVQLPAQLEARDKLPLIDLTEEHLAEERESVRDGLSLTRLVVHQPRRHRLSHRP